MHQLCRNTVKCLNTPILLELAKCLKVSMLKHKYFLIRCLHYLKNSLILHTIRKQKAFSHQEMRTASDSLLHLQSKSQCPRAFSSGSAVEPCANHSIHKERESQKCVFYLTHSWRVGRLFILSRFECHHDWILFSITAYITTPFLLFLKWNKKKFKTELQSNTKFTFQWLEHKWSCKEPIYEYKVFCLDFKNTHHQPTGGEDLFSRQPFVIQYVEITIQSMMRCLKLKDSVHLNHSP